MTARWAFVAAVLVVACGGGGKGPGPSGSASASGSVAAPARPKPKLAGATERRLIAPWTEGTDVSGYTVKNAYGVVDGTLWVVLQRGTDATSQVALQINRTGGSGPLPPFVAEPYAIYYVARDEYRSEAKELASALFERVKANLGGPVPAGLGPFRPEVAAPLD